MTKKIKLNEQVHKCPICGKTFRGFGNNPAPLRKSGRCCDDCNSTYVIPYRIILFRLREAKERANKSA